jgi:predicted aspartyl protease
MQMSFLHQVVPVFYATMNGEPVRMLLDTGAGVSIITPATARAAKLPPYPHHDMRLSGLGGEVYVHTVTVRNFRIGTAAGFVFHFPVVRIFGTSNPLHGAIDGIFGADILRNYDVDLDFPTHQVILMAVNHCVVTAPWRGAHPVRFRVLRGGQIVFPITINHRPVIALLDTGSSDNIMLASLFRASGLSATRPKFLRPLTGHGIGGRVFKNKLYGFNTASIGGMTVNHPVIAVGGQSPLGSRVIIGESFIRRHEIYISYATRTLYIRPATADQPSLF